MKIWVAKDEDGTWWVFDTKPVVREKHWDPEVQGEWVSRLGADTECVSIEYFKSQFPEFSITLDDDVPWKESLIKSIVHLGPCLYIYVSRNGHWCCYPRDRRSKSIQLRHLYDLTGLVPVNWDGQSEGYYHFVQEGEDE